MKKYVLKNISVKQNRSAFNRYKKLYTFQIEEAWNECFFL